MKKTITEPELTDKETAKHIRKYVKEGIHNPFCWATDGCGYKQHIKFVKHRNKNWHGGDFEKFLLDYADKLDET